MREREKMPDRRKGNRISRGCDQTTAMAVSGSIDTD